MGYAVVVPEGSHDVTIKSLNPGSGIILGPGDLGNVDLESFLWFAGDGTNPNGAINNKNWKIQNLDIRNFDLSIGMQAGVDGAFDGVQVTGNHILIPTDLRLCASRC